MNKRRRKIGFVKGSVICLCMVMVGLSAGMWYSKQPVYQLQKYMRMMNQRDYSKVYDYFFEEQMPVSLSKEEVMSYMAQYAKDLGLVRLEKGKMTYKSEEKAFYEVVYCTNKGRVGQVVSVIKKQDAWEVVFPFETYDLQIDAPEGTRVCVNGREVIVDDAGEYQLKVLSGEYTVRLSYAQGIQADYVAKVKVPQVTEVESPYEMTPVSVQSPIGTVVELAGVQKKNQTGTVVFDKVLEGAYELKVFDSKGYIDPITRHLVVQKDMKPIVIKTPQLSEAGETAFKTFVGSFYEDYLASIQSGETTGLEKYLEPLTKQEIIEVFKGWFIANKKIQKAELTVELDRVEMSADGRIRANILEVVTMTNQETLENGLNKEKAYQVLLRWDTHFTIGEGGYQLETREILESVVSQKDSEGKWIQY